MKSRDELAMHQIERRLASLRKAEKDSRVRPGWIRYMRNALGMTLKNLSMRAGVSIATIAQAERSEAKGKVTVETLRTMAAAMECEFVYAFVPKNKLKEILQSQAELKAKKLLKSADVHMSLEDQQVKQSMSERIERLAAKLIETGEVW